MSEECLETNIPTVDNTEVQCQEYISDECLIITDPHPLIGVLPNSSIKKVVAALVDKLRNQSILIKNLTTRIEDLENE